MAESVHEELDCLMGAADAVDEYYVELDPVEDGRRRGSPQQEIVMECQLDEMLEQVQSKMQELGLTRVELSRR